MLRTARFLRAYLKPEVVRWREEETHVEVNGEPREATLYRPLHARGPVPGWVVLHGLTVPGRHHLAMVRFVRALTASGAAVLVPDVPAWRALRIDTRAARDTIAAAARHLVALPGTAPGGVAVTGFSFGATQALMAAADPSLHGVVHTVASFGGYGDLARLMRTMMTGEHEWNGVAERIDPDPYGRWIVFANYLTHVPGFEHMAAVADAARELARAAGEDGRPSWDAVYDPLKRSLREGLTEEEQAVWDMVSPPAGVPPEQGPLMERLSHELTAAALRVDPGLDPSAALPGMRARVALSHGVDDRLIPYTESLRLHALLAPVTDTSLTLTRLFAHSEHAGGNALHYVREGWKFARLLNRALSSP